MCARRFPSQSLPESTLKKKVPHEHWAQCSFFFPCRIFLHWRWNYCIFCSWGQHHILCMWTTHLFLKKKKKSKNRLIFFPAGCAVSSTSPGNECKCVRYIPLYLCSLESAIYCVLCISFSPVCLTPKTTALNEQVPRGSRRKRLSFLFFFYFCTLFGIWMIFMEIERYVWSLEYLKNSKYFVQLSEHWVGGEAADVLLLRNRCLSHLLTTFIKKRLSDIPYGLFTTAYK